MTTAADELALSRKYARDGAVAQRVLIFMVVTIFVLAALHGWPPRHTQPTHTGQPG